jgi:hypothetical protein
LYADFGDLIKDASNPPAKSLTPARVLAHAGPSAFINASRAARGRAGRAAATMWRFLSLPAEMFGSSKDEEEEEEEGDDDDDRDEGRITPGMVCFMVGKSDNLSAAPLMGIFERTSSSVILRAGPFE